MDALERMLATQRGAARDRLACQPLFMTFGARLSGVRYRDYVLDHRKLVESYLRVLDEFGLDAVSCCSDAWREAHDCGADVVFFDDAPPACKDHLLADKSAFAGLKMPSPEAGPRMADRVNAVALFAERLRGETPIVGWVEGPVAEAADLRGINELMVDTIDDLPFVLDLFDWVTEMEIAFARAQVRAGAHVIGIGDAAASLISPGFYEGHALPREKRMVEAIHEEGALVRLHICGNTNHLLPGLARLGVDQLELDYPVDFARARETVGPDVVLMGNFDPVRVVRNGRPDDVRRACEACHHAAGDRYILAAGCEIPVDTPHDNVRAMVDYARSGAL